MYASPSFYNNIGFYKYKSDEKANEFLQIGQESFKKNFMLEALVFCNKAISFSSSSLLTAISYANRSAVYFEIQRYAECLENIKLAQENGYWGNELNKRMQICKKLLKSIDCAAENPWKFFQMSYPSNEKVPWVVDCLEVRETDKFGRGIYAKRGLKPGDILSIEEPTFCILREDSLYKHCYNCLKTRFLNLIPCNRTASMMFCSTECMEKAYAQTNEMETILCDDVKILSKVAAPFEGIEEFDEYMARKDLNQLKNTIFDYDFSNPNDPNYNKNLSNCFISLSKTKSQSININNCNIQSQVSKKTADHILDILLLNNMTHIYHDFKTSKIQKDVASVPLFASLINHSCMSNVQPIFFDNKIAICVSKPINEGEQLFFSYVNQNDPLSDLFFKTLTFSNCKFMCKCESCTDENFNVPPAKIDTSLLTRVVQNEGFKNIKEYLSEAWKNANSLKSKEESEKLKIGNFLMLEQIAYNCTFPC